MSEAIGSGLDGSERWVAGSGRTQLQGSMVSWADTPRGGWAQAWEPRAAGAQLGGRWQKHWCPPPSAGCPPPLSILSLLSFTGSEGLVGCRGQKAFTEKVKLQSGLKDSSRATFPLELDRVGTSVEILYFWLIFITCLFSLLCFLPLARTQLSSL